MRRHRAVRSRRHDLPQRLFTTVARSKHTRNVRLRALARHKIPVFVKVKNIAYKVRRRHIAHRHKHAVAGRVIPGAVAQMLHLDGHEHALLAAQGAHLGVPHEGDVF